MSEQKKNQQKKGRVATTETVHRVVITENIGVTDAVTATVRSSTEKLAEKYADTLKELSKT